MKLLAPKSLDRELLKIRNRSENNKDFAAALPKAHKPAPCPETIAPVTHNDFKVDRLESDHVFHESHIREICVKYRLRFLPVKMFRHALPDAALDAWMQLENLHQTPIEGLMIAAPSKAFHLKNYDDPMLFAPMGNSYYYLVHKWGDDVSPLRQWKYWPVKNLMTFLVFNLLASALVTWLLPINKLGTALAYAPLIIFLFTFKSLVGTIGYYFFMSGKNFSSEIWDRPFKEN